MRMTDMLWDPIVDLMRFQREMNRLLDAYCRPADVFPRMNAKADDESAVVQVELPGVDPASVKVSVAGDVLTIEGERPSAIPDTAKEVHRQERATGSFARSLRLPWEVEADKVTASHKNGVLTVTLPRREATKPRTVAVTAE
ncbi:MAG: Hsp20/alpha crystallin family protein [Kiritimatiellae bacterium]|nr:Hsp20/alpha crystallin family protein [Kiritimatiellia bacterium]